MGRHHQHKQEEGGGVQQQLQDTVELTEVRLQVGTLKVVVFRCVQQLVPKQFGTLPTNEI